LAQVSSPSGVPAVTKVRRTVDFEFGSVHYCPVSGHACSERTNILFPPIALPSRPGPLKSTIMTSSFVGGWLLVSMSNAHLRVLV
jgi:hypothetical protein